ncbi:hypothetical protein [Nonomuraea sp. NPDC003804]|uniref:hypothetical protein n=1 Tax=Nonomuraea sp. NPDC003804 TaxID=3154547 RepID=UPI0033ACEC36
MAAAQEGSPAGGEPPAPRVVPGKALAAKLGTGGLVAALVFSGSLPWALGIAGALLLSSMAIVAMALARKDDAMFERLLCLLALVCGRAVTRYLSALRDASRPDRRPELQAVPKVPREQLPAERCDEAA